jgi:hypothetical protein
MDHSIICFISENPSDCVADLCWGVRLLDVVYLLTHSLDRSKHLTSVRPSSFIVAACVSAHSADAAMLQQFALPSVIGPRVTCPANPTCQTNRAMAVSLKDQPSALRVGIFHMWMGDSKIYGLITPIDDSNDVFVHNSMPGAEFFMRGDKVRLLCIYVAPLPDTLL